MKVVIVEDEIAGLVTNPGTILVGYLSTGKREVLDRVIASRDQDGLPIGNMLGADKVNHAANPSQGYVGVNGCEVIDVSSRLNLDGVAGGNGTALGGQTLRTRPRGTLRSEEHTSEL